MAPPLLPTDVIPPASFSAPAATFKDPYFIRLVSTYVIWRQVRLTLALHYMLPGEDKLAVLQALLSILIDRRLVKLALCKIYSGELSRTIHQKS